MSFKKACCGNRIKSIREQYKFTHTDTVKYCSQRNRVNLSQSTLSLWENGKRIPTIENFTKLADLFAIDLNWLTGRSNEKYNEPVLKSLEPSSFPILITTKNTVTELPIKIPQDYIDNETRKKTYDFEARANIIFLITILKWEWDNYIYEHIYEIQDLTTEEKKLKAEELSKYFYMKISKIKLVKDCDAALKEIFQTKTAKFTET